MPVIKCGNGKYRIGEGACVFETRETAEKAQNAMYARARKTDRKTTMNRFNDVVSLNLKRVVDSNGFAHVPAVVTRVGVQEYREDQLGLGIKGARMVKVFRGPETVFHKDTIESFKHLPVTDGHPQGGVSTRNAKIVQGGHTGEDVAKMTDQDLGVTIHLTDEVFISRSKGSQTSAGYDATIVKESGEYNGEKYEYRFDGAMIGNHLALVDAARCGDACRVLDEKNQKEKKPMERGEVQELIADAIKANNEANAVIIADTIKTALADQKAKDDADAKTKADEAAAKLKADEAATKKEEQIKADAKASAELRVSLKPLLGEKFDDSKTDKELMVLAFADRVDDAESKSLDYLKAFMDQELKDRDKAPAKFGDNLGGNQYGAVSVKAIK